MNAAAQVDWYCSSVLHLMLVRLFLSMPSDTSICLSMILPSSLNLIHQSKWCGRCQMTSIPEQHRKINSSSVSHRFCHDGICHLSTYDISGVPGS